MKSSLSFLFSILVVVGCASHQEPKNQNTVTFDRRGVDLMKENKALVGPWSTYAMMLNACAGTSSGNGKPDKPTFKCEVMAREFAASNWEDALKKDPSVSDTYLSELLKVKTAGYLEAYVKHYLYRPEWGNVSVANYNEFLEWQKTNLVGHTVQTRMIASFK